jgi:hypothetical protein
MHVTSRSKWVKEKVNNFVVNGYRPDLDYDIRIDVEPLKEVTERVSG